eukprot:15353291-Ditylum_brightwellii.AAC.1
MNQIAALTPLACSSSAHEGYISSTLKAKDTSPPCSVIHAHPNKSKGNISSQYPQGIAHQPLVIVTWGGQANSQGGKNPCSGREAGEESDDGATDCGVQYCLTRNE